MTTQCDQSQDPFIPGPATFLRVNVLHNRCGLVGIVTTVRSGQREHPRLVLEVGGTSTLQVAMPGKLKSPPLGTLKWGDFSRVVHAGLTKLYLSERSPDLRAQSAVWSAEVCGVREDPPELLEV